MEDKKSLSIKTVPVEIRVLTVDGKRMTLSVFNQIITGDGAIYSFTGINFVKIAEPLGWVKIKPSRGESETYLIYSNDGVLYKNTKNSVIGRCFGKRNIPGYPKHNNSIYDIYNSYIGQSVQSLFGYANEYTRPWCVEDVYNNPLPTIDISKYSKSDYEHQLKNINTIEKYRGLYNEMMKTLEKYEREIIDIESTVNGLFGDKNQIFISI